MEIDRAVAETAREALDRTGYGEVTVVAADGTQGFAARAPYDRVLSTASCQQVPYPWVAQTACGGKVLTPWLNAYYPGGLLSLTVGADGTATGGIVDSTWFMQLRDQRLPQCRHRYFSYDPDEGTGELWFLDPWSGSWASHFHVTPDCSDEQFSVRQHGPRRLWDEVQAAHTWWTEQGRPDEQDWLFTVRPDRQTISLPTRRGWLAGLPPRPDHRRQR